MNKIIKIALYTIVIVSLFIAIILGIYNIRSNMPKSHVYVCDNSEHPSMFDLWLTDDLQLDWVPSYIIINNHNVVGIIDGGLSVTELRKKIDNAVETNYVYGKLPEYTITNLENKSNDLNTIMPDDGLYILEICWIDCKDCTYQDKHFTNNIYASYTTDHIYRYYINSEVKDVKNKYN